MTNQVNIMPMIALRGTTVLPEMIVHFDVSREKSIRAVEAAMLHDQKVFLLTQTWKWKHRNLMICIG